MTFEVSAGIGLLTRPMSSVTRTRGGAPGELSRDEVFDLLANTRRRFALHYLHSVEGAADLRDMAARVAAWEYGRAVDELTADQRKRVYTSLQQTHLRKLDDAGIVDFDDEAARVHPTETTDDIEVYLEVVPGRAFPWREYYLGLGAVASALVIVGWADVGPFALVPDIAFAALVAGALLLSAVAHVGHERSRRLGENERPPGLPEAD
jgi:predicted transcriptional regulator